MQLTPCRMLSEHEDQEALSGGNVVDGGGGAVDCSLASGRGRGIGGEI